MKLERKEPDQTCSSSHVMSFWSGTRVTWPSLYFRRSEASWEEDCGQARGRPLPQTGEGCPAKHHPSHLRWQIVISMNCSIVLEFLFVIASGTDLWENLSLITNSISILGFKLILALSTRRNCQWRFTVIFKRMCCRLRKYLEWVPTMLWTIADSFKLGYRQASHEFEGDST